MGGNAMDAGKTVGQRQVVPKSVGHCPAHWPRRQGQHGVGRSIVNRRQAPRIGSPVLQRPDHQQQGHHQHGAPHACGIGLLNRLHQGLGGLAGSSRAPRRRRQPALPPKQCPSGRAPAETPPPAARPGRSDCQRLPRAANPPRRSAAWARVERLAARASMEPSIRRARPATTGPMLATAGSTTGRPAQHPQADDGERAAVALHGPSDAVLFTSPPAWARLGDLPRRGESAPTDPAAAATTAMDRWAPPPNQAGRRKHPAAPAPADAQ